MKFNHEQKMLLKIYRMRGKIDLSPEYQRGKVWTKERKQLLIDTILKGMHIPAVYLRDLENDYFECVDGQQRLSTIFDFFEDKLEFSKKYSPEFAGKTFSKLPQKIKDKFEDHEIIIVKLTNSTDEEIREMFDRLQRGMALTSGEKLNAKTGAMHDFISELAKNQFFTKIVNIRDYRGAYHQVCAQITNLEINGIVDVRFRNLEDLYNKNKKFDKESTPAKRIKKVFNFLAKAFSDKTPELHTRAGIISLYLLVSEIMKNYAIKEQHTLINKFVIDFESKLNIAEEKENDIELTKYINCISHSSDGAQSIKERHNIIMSYFLAFANQLEPLDDKRGFTEAQRIAIFRKDKGICQNEKCGKKVNYNDFHADHIKPHVKGGKTTVKNGQLLCSKCNLSKGAK